MKVAIITNDSTYKSDIYDNLDDLKDNMKYNDLIPISNGIFINPNSITKVEVLDYE